MIRISDIGLLWEFYKRVFPINASLSVLLFLFRFQLIPLLFFFCTIGFALALLYLQVFREFNYFFYYNCGLTKTKLFAVSAGVNFMVSALVYIMVLWGIG